MNKVPLWRTAEVARSTQGEGANREYATKLPAGWVIRESSIDPKEGISFHKANRG